MSRRVSLGAALFFTVLLAAVAVSVLVVRARSPDLVLEVTAGLPTTIEQGERARMTFFVREDEPGARVAIVDSHEEVVSTLAESAELERDEEATYFWDGETDEGEPVRPGRYRLLVELPGSDRTMIWPRRITVGHPPPPPEPEDR